MGLKKDFGIRLKELRLKKHFTQEELSEKVAIDAKHMSHIETGRSFPKADLLEKFSKELNISIPELFNFSHLRPKNELLQEIIILLNNLTEKDIQRLYKIIIAYVK